MLSPCPLVIYTRAVRRRPTGKHRRKESSLKNSFNSGVVFLQKMNTFGSFFLISCIAVSSAWHLRVSLNDIFKGNCRTVSPRVCRKSLQAFDPDYSCGFILRSVCSGTNKIERVRTRRSALTVRQHGINQHFLQYC